MRILIVDDHPVVREGVQRILEEQVPGADVEGVATGREALERLSENVWDAVLLDISLGGESGVDLLADIKALRPTVPVLVLTMHAEEQYAWRVLKAGASGYVTKDTSRAVLVDALHTVVQGRTYTSPALAERLAADLRSTLPVPHDILSPREFQVMRLLGSGRTVMQIAELLGLSDKTVSTYRSRVLEKLGLTTSAELIRYVLKNKLIE